MHVGHEAYVASWTVTCKAATLTKAVGGTEVPTATGNNPLLFKARIKFVPQWMHTLPSWKLLPS